MIFGESGWRPRRSGVAVELHGFQVTPSSEKIAQLANSLMEMQRAVLLQTVTANASKPPSSHGLAGVLIFSVGACRTAGFPPWRRTRFCNFGHCQLPFGLDFLCPHKPNSFA